MKTYLKNMKLLYNIDTQYYFTSPGLAMATFRTNYYKSKESGISLLEDDMNNTLSSAYFDGVVYVYNPFFYGIGYYYDVNSLYPWSMPPPLRALPCVYPVLALCALHLRGLRACVGLAVLKGRRLEPTPPRAQV